MAAESLFGVDIGPVSRSSNSSSEKGKGKPRLIRANRHQLRLESRSLDELISDDHRARTLWLASEKLDLSAFYAEIDAVESGPGRPAIDPRILLVLWLFAISEGVGSARQLSRLCVEHDAYRWITGGLEICHRVLSDFRVQHDKKLDQLLTELLASLMKAGVITLRTVAQDGTRVRASAGAASFRRRKSLKKCLREAKQQVKALKNCFSVYAPVPHNPKTRDPNKPRQRVDSPQVAAWKERMQTDEAKEIYKLRGSTIEPINGDLKDHRGMTRFRVRGLSRVQSVLTLCVLTYNLLRAFVIAPEVVLPSTAWATALPPSEAEGVARWP